MGSCTEVREEANTDSDVLPGVCVSLILPFSKASVLQIYSAAPEAQLMVRYFSSVREEADIAGDVTAQCCHHYPVTHPTGSGPH